MPLESLFNILSCYSFWLGRMHS